MEFGVSINININIQLRLLLKLANLALTYEFQGSRLYTDDTTVLLTVIQSNRLIHTMTWSIWLVMRVYCELYGLKNYWQVIISGYESQTGIIYLSLAVVAILTEVR